MSDDFSFERFVQKAKTGAFGRDEAARYAYSADVTMLRSFQRIRPVELAAAAVVRTSKEMLRGQLLGQGVQFGPALLEQAGKRRLDGGVQGNPPGLGRVAARPGGDPGSAATGGRQGEGQDQQAPEPAREHGSSSRGDSRWGGAQL